MVTITGTEQKDRLLDGRYELLRQLGAGGMGRVYLAEDVVLHRRVAVKLLQPHCAADPAFEERLRREARAAAALTHPHVVPVHDLGENQGAPYIVMRYVPGETLKERVMRRGALPVEEAFRIADQTLQAVDHAHSNGVIHRDLTARNILLDERDDVQVTDFGIARLGSSPLTSAPAMLGTAHYAAPEQVRGIGGDARSDVYTVGIVLYEMLTGELPFSGDDAMAVALQHVNEPPPAPSSRHPALGPELDALVLRALEKEPGRRYQSAAEFRRAIRAVAEGHAPAERPPVAADAAAADGHAAALARAAVSGVAVASDEPAAVAGDGSAAAAAGALDLGPGSTIVAAADPQTKLLVRETGARVDYRGDRRPSRQRWRRVTIGLATLIVIAGGCAAAAHWFFGRTVEVPRAVAMTRPQAEALLRESGLDAVVRYEYVDGVDSGRVSRQAPRAGSDLRRGEPVRLWVSSGPLHVQIPDLRDMTAKEAARAVRSRGLLAAGSKGRTDDVEPGHVYRQDPAPGTSLARGDKVTYWVSVGPTRVTVPDVMGSYFENAVVELQDHGFTVDVQSSVGWGSTPLTVISQEPAAGSEAERGSQVVIEVAIL